MPAFAIGVLTVFQGTFNFSGAFQGSGERVNVFGNFEPQIGPQPINSEGFFRCDSANTCSGVRNIITSNNQSHVGPRLVTIALQPAPGERVMVLQCPAFQDTGVVIAAGSANINVQ